tara:strand:+ start:24538 stop:25860 length:1323 start_codon:yes stop_codon:yes gene_type:complete
MIDPETGEAKRSVFKEMRLDEISAVDRPAQPGATMSIMKRAGIALGIVKAKLEDELEPGDEGYVEKKGKNPFASADDDEATEAEDKGEKPGKKKPKKGKNPFAAATKRALLTTPTDGHQHLLSDEVGPDMRAGAGQTGIEAGSDGAFHSHSWMIDGNGVVQIGEAQGHTHSVLLSSQAGASAAILDLSKQAAADVPDVTDASTSSGVPADSVGTFINEATMSEKNDQTADIEAVAKQLQEITKRAERAEAVSELNDAQRGIFKSLDEAGQAAFLALSPDARQAEVAKAADVNAVVEVVDGVEYRKSDDPRLLQLAKSAASEKALRLAGEEKAKDADLRKRAEALHLPGTVEVRMSVLKGIDSLPADEQAPALEALAASDAGLAEAFKRQGTSAVPSSINELEAIAKSLRAADPSLSPEQATANALSTPEGEAAYNKSLGF